MATGPNIADILETTGFALRSEDSGLMVASNRIALMHIADGLSVHTESFLSYFADRGYAVHRLTFNRSKMKNARIHYLSPSKADISEVHSTLAFDEEDPIKYSSCLLRYAQRRTH